MSNVYTLEPPTKGKVILKTSLGDLEIELWAKEAPKACRNFVQLCLEGYYDDTIFHRIIKDYLVQGGDPTGTGDCSESVYGGPFKDEFHSRLKFTHRGLVACANQNQPNTNGSQFFVTLDETTFLDKKNTIFGKVVGDTIYNLLRIGEQGTDEDDRPLEPPVLKEAEVVWNPFDDIVPRRDRREEKEEAASREAEAAEAQRKRAKASKGRNLGLLSFGDEAEEDGDEPEALPSRKKIASAHDVLNDKRLAKEDETPDEERIYVPPPRAKRTREEEEAAAAALGRTKAVLGGVGDDEDEGGQGSGGGASFAASMRERMLNKRREMGDEPAARLLCDRAGDAGDARRKGSGADDGGDSGSGSGEEGGGGARRERSERNQRIDELRLENKRKGIQRMGAKDAITDADLLKPWQVAREQYKQRKRLIGNREKDTLARLNKFSAALRGSGASDADRQSEPELGAAAASGRNSGDIGDVGKGYDGKVDTDIDHAAYLPAAWRVDDYLDRDDLDASLDDLRAHRLSFAKGRTEDKARDVHNADDYVVFDPLLEKGKGKFSKAEQAKRKRGSEWSGRATM